MGFIARVDDSRKVGVSLLKPYQCTEQSLGRQFRERKIGTVVLGYEEMKTRIKRGKWQHFKGRMIEIEKLIRHRHGGFIPQADDSFIYAEVISNLAFVEFEELDFLKYVTAWCRKWLPWASVSQIEEIIYDRTKVRFAPLSSDALGYQLHVSFAERCELDLRTIGCFDVPKSKRTKLQRQKRKDRDRARKAVLRRAAGMKTREAYLAAALTQSCPWELFGWSRRTWERKGKPVPPVSHKNFANRSFFIRIDEFAALVAS